MAKILKTADITPEMLDAFVRADLQALLEAQREEALRAMQGPEEEEEEAPDPQELAAAILEEARQKAEQKVREAYAEGHRRGLEAGRTAFQEQVREAAGAAAAAAERMVQAREAFLASLEPQVVALVQLIARTVVGREPALDPQLVAAMARRALAALTERESVTVHVNPQDLEALESHRAGLLDEFRDVSDLSIQPDDAVASGGCYVETREVDVDARLEHQLEEVFAALLQPAADEEAEPTPEEG